MTLFDYIKFDENWSEAVSKINRNLKIIEEQNNVNAKNGSPGFVGLPGKPGYRGEIGETGNADKFFVIPSSDFNFNFDVTKKEISLKEYYKILYTYLNVITSDEYNTLINSEDTEDTKEIKSKIDKFKASINGDEKQNVYAIILNSSTVYKLIKINHVNEGMQLIFNNEGIIVNTSSVGGNIGGAFKVITQTEDFEVSGENNYIRGYTPIKASNFLSLQNLYVESENTLIPYNKYSVSSINGNLPVREVMTEQLNEKLFNTIYSGTINDYDHKLILTNGINNNNIDTDSYAPLLLLGNISDEISINHNTYKVLEKDKTKAFRSFFGVGIKKYLKVEKDDIYDNELMFISRGDLETSNSNNNDISAIGFYVSELRIGNRISNNNLIRLSNNNGTLKINNPLEIIEPIKITKVDSLLLTLNELTISHVGYIYKIGADNQTDPISFYNDNKNTLLYIDRANKRIGINTIPEYELDIDGTFRLTEDLIISNNINTTGIFTKNIGSSVNPFNNIWANNFKTRAVTNSGGNSKGLIFNNYNEDLTQGIFGGKYNNGNLNYLYIGKAYNNFGIQVNIDTSVILRYNNNTKLSTTNEGIDVDGDLNVTGIHKRLKLNETDYAYGNSGIEFLTEVALQNCELIHETTNTEIPDSGQALILQDISDTSQPTHLWVKNGNLYTQKIGIGNISASTVLNYLLEVNGNSKFTVPNSDNDEIIAKFIHKANTSEVGAGIFLGGSDTDNGMGIKIFGYSDLSPNYNSRMAIYTASGIGEWNLGLTQDKDGNIGIDKIANSNYKLDVNGAGYFLNNVTAGTIALNNLLPTANNHLIRQDNIIGDYDTFNDYQYVNGNKSRKFTIGNRDIYISISYIKRDNAYILHGKLYSPGGSTNETGDYVIQDFLPDELLKSVNFNLTYKFIDNDILDLYILNDGSLRINIKSTEDTIINDTYFNEISQDLSGTPLGVTISLPTANLIMPALIASVNPPEIVDFTFNISANPSIEPDYFKLFFNNNITSTIIIPYVSGQTDYTIRTNNYPYFQQISWCIETVKNNYASKFSLRRILRLPNLPIATLVNPPEITTTDPYHINITFTFNISAIPSIEPTSFNLYLDENKTPRTLNGTIAYVSGQTEYTIQLNDYETTYRDLYWRIETIRNRFDSQFSSIENINELRINP